MGTQADTRRQALLDSARLNRLLKAAILAYMLEDAERLEHLLGQVDVASCEAVAHQLELEADLLRPGVGLDSLPRREKAPSELASRHPLDDELTSAVVVYGKPSTHVVE